MPEKGFGGLIDSMRHVPEVDLVLAGAGPLEAELAERASAIPNVTLVGLLDPGPLLSLFAGARAVVVPSLFYETFGYVVAEAAGVGTPAIVHDRGARSRAGRLGRRRPRLPGSGRVGGRHPRPGRRRCAARPRLGNVRGRPPPRELWSEELHVDRYLAILREAGLLGVDVDREGHARVGAGG